MSQLVQVSKRGYCLACRKLIPDNPHDLKKYCVQCKHERDRQSANMRYRTKYRFKRLKKKNCLRCRNEIPPVETYRKNLCRACQIEVIHNFKNPQVPCAYCGKVTPKGHKYCSHSCQANLFVLVYGRKKN